MTGVLIKCNYFGSLRCLFMKRWASTLNYYEHGVTVYNPDTDLPGLAVVAILGWNDAKIKNLQKYSQIFENKNWTTLCVPATSFNTFFQPSHKVKIISNYVIGLLKQLTSGEKPVILYSLSSGGCTVYYYIAKALNAPNHSGSGVFKVVGAIFDSCPVKNSKEAIGRLQISVTERVKNPIIKNLIWYGVAMTMPLVVKWEPLLPKLYDELKTTTINCPELYLYSKVDKLALYEDIDEFIKYRESMGHTLLQKCWDDSHHVSHYLKYPEEYLNLLEQFLRICLKQD